MQDLSWLFFPELQARKGFFGEMIGWFIRVVIYDICVTTIQEVFGVSRFVAIFIFLGILLVIGFGSYVIKQKSSKAVDAET
ncbi:MAG: hypothetical protein IT290_05175 [Deltaproteobacteria bacterium]|nr:hypothetical protein [Deltaproteobacteria bacterium]